MFALTFRGSQAGETQRTTPRQTIVGLLKSKAKKKEEVLQLPTGEQQYE